MPQNNVDRINHVCLIILAVVAVTAALIYTKSVMTLLIFSFFLYTVLATGIGFIDRYVKIQRWVSVTLMMFLMFLLSVVFISMMTNSIEEFVRGAKEYQSKFLEFVHWIELQASIFGVTIDTSIAQKFSRLHLFSYAQGLTASIFTIIGKTFVVFIMTMFMILGKQKAEIQNEFLAEIHSKISKYITVKIWISLMTSGAFFIILTAFQVDLAIMFSVLAFVLNFIPSLGSIIVTVLPLPLIFLQYDISAKSFIIFILLSIVQIILGSVLEPKLLGEKLDLHPVTVLMSLLFWGLVWGLPGMFLAVPITAIVKIILSKIESTEDIAGLLAGRLPGKS
ncbi:MAG: AI-2E family transporter [Bdellovibrionales bacterium]|nr:AI-2E family transporter [Bdellovibrionales bacterium]